MVPEVPEPNGSFDAVKSVALGMGGLIPTAFLARMLYRYRLVSLGRKFWSRGLLWELPTAGFSAVIGSGLAIVVISFLPDSISNDAYKQFMVTNSIVGICSWLGPRGMEVFLSQVMTSYFPKRGNGHHEPD